MELAAQLDLEEWQRILEMGAPQDVAPQTHEVVPSKDDDSNKV